MNQKEEIEDLEDSVFLSRGSVVLHVAVLQVVLVLQGITLTTCV